MTHPMPSEERHPAADLDLATLAYVRESMVGIQVVGGTIDPIALIDSIIDVRAELRGESPDTANDREETLGDVELEAFRAFHEWYRAHRQRTAALPPNTRETDAAVRASAEALIIAFRRWYEARHGQPPSDDDFRRILEVAGSLR